MKAEFELKRTLDGSKYGHPNLRFCCDLSVVVEGELNYLVAFFERQIAAGTKFEPGAMLQIGWLILQIGTSDDGVLIVMEPDMKGSPVNFVDSVTQTLTHLRLQKSSLESFGLENLLSLPSLRQSCVVCNQLAAGEKFTMERGGRGGNDSGWFIHCADPAHDHAKIENLKRVPLYDVGCELKRSLLFYGFPKGSVIQVQPTGTTVIWQGMTLQPKEGSFIATLNQTA